MIMLDRTIVATAEIAEALANRTGREENDPRAWLYRDASWSERRLFDWAYTAAALRRSGMEAEAAYADSRIAEILAR